MASSPAPRQSLSSVPERVLSPSRTAAAEARRAARREQMRDYYGLNPGAAPAPGSPAALAAPSAAGASSANNMATPTKARRERRAEGNPGARDLSSPNFVPAEYYEDLISKASLSELLKATSTLATDVGRLQSSRHTLVYNHHPQLFSAGDAITQLNTRTPQLLSIVTSLQERFSDMSQLADSVALPEPSGGADGVVRARETVGCGLERVRLMATAGESALKIREAWGRVEEAVKDAPKSAPLEELLEEGRKVTGWTPEADKAESAKSE